MFPPVFQPSILSRLGLKRQESKNRKHQRPQIETPWRVEPDGSGAHLLTNGDANETTNSQTVQPPPDSALKFWPSIASLHCIGWAKVVTSYVPKKPGELSLLEGSFACFYIEFQMKNNAVVVL